MPLIFSGNNSVAQELVDEKEIFDALEDHDTTKVLEYFQSGGSIDAFKIFQIDLSAQNNRKKKMSVNLFEQAINSVHDAVGYNVERDIVCGYRNLDILLEHLDESADRQELLDRAFSHVISTNDVELVRRWAQLGADINHQCHVCYGRPPLLIAVMYNENFELIKFLFSLNPDLAVVDYDGRCCIHYGAFVGTVELMEYLVKTSGLDINTPDKFGATPIYYAVERGNIAVYNYLLKKGADVNFTTSFGKTVLHAAAENGNVEFFRHVYYTSGLSLWNDGLFRKEPYTYATSEEVQLFIKRTTMLERGDNFFDKKRRKMKLQRIFTRE